MIIEGAFLKLPELLVSSYDHRDTFEETVGHSLSIAVLMELNSRNIPFPYKHICKEKPYPTRRTGGTLLHSDVWVGLSGTVETYGRMASYGTREQNWIEIKAPLTILRSGGPSKLIRNSGQILRDLLRICILPQEHQGHFRQNGRYFMFVSSRPVLACVYSGSNDWVKSLFLPGTSEFEIDVGKEPRTFHQALGRGFETNPLLHVRLKTLTMVLEPERKEPAPVFWCYLLRIKSFDIQSSCLSVGFDDIPDDHWDASRLQALESVRQDVLIRIAG